MEYVKDIRKKGLPRVAADMESLELILIYTTHIYTTTTAEDDSHALGAEDASLLIIQAKHCTFWPLERARAED